MRKHYVVSKGQLSLLDYIVDASKPKKTLTAIVKTTPRKARVRADFPQKKDKLDSLFRHYLSQHAALERIMKYHRDI